jgi:hypothetical protein
MGRMVVPTLSLTEMARMTRVSRGFHRVATKRIQEKYMLTDGHGKVAYNLGALYEEYRHLDDDESAIGFVQLVTDVIDRLKADANYMLHAAITYSGSRSLCRRSLPWCLEVTAVSCCPIYAKSRRPSSTCC